MSELTADQLGQRALASRLLDAREIDRAVSEAGGRTAPYQQLQSLLLQKELLTNWQIQRLIEGHRQGFFYGHWKVLYLIGAGTFARVYRGSHIKTADIKAIKVLRSRYSSDTGTQDSFLREAKVVMKLRHPNIVPIYEVDDDKGRIYMVMDFVEGQNLRDYVRAHNKLSVKIALNIIRDLAAGLDHAFEFGICHRDLKLSNVLLSTKGQAKIVDFGLAAVNTDDGKGEENFNPRSIDYAGLEITSGVQRDDMRSDVYFLGCMLYHMLTGQSPLDETRERIKRLSPKRFKEIEPITNLQPGLPHRVVILVHRLMELDPKRRPQTPGLALHEIDTVMEAIEAGHTEQFDASLAQQLSANFERKARKQSEGDGRTVMLIESNVKVQDALRDKLKELGYRVLIIGNAERGVRRFHGLNAAEDRPADCVIFGCTGLGRVGLEAFDYFINDKSTNMIPAILLAHPELTRQLSTKLSQSHHVALELPLKFKSVRSTLLTLLSTAEHQP